MVKLLRTAKAGNEYRTTAERPKRRTFPIDAIKHEATEHFTLGRRMVREATAPRIAERRKATKRTMDPPGYIAPHG